MTNSDQGHLLTRIAELSRQITTARPDDIDDIDEALGIALEFLEGYELLDFEGPCVTVFGSAKLGEGSRWYDLTRQIGRGLAEAGFVVMTGGGPGIMEAANRGAKEGGGLSLGCNIKLPHEQFVNRYVDRSVECEHFFSRKVILAMRSSAFIIMPGGYGTLNEAFEMLTLVETHKIAPFPIVWMGVEYWGPLFEFLRADAVAEGTLTDESASLMHLTDSVPKAIEHIRSLHY